MMRSGIAGDVAAKWTSFKANDFELEKPTVFIELAPAHREVGIRAIFISGPFINHEEGIVGISRSSMEFLKHLGVQYEVVHQLPS